MGKNIIVSEETVRDLLEAHASLSAWYYELWAALRSTNGTASSPSDAARAAFVERMAGDFPELAAVAKQIRVPRMFVPAPPAVAVVSRPPGAPDEPATLIEPAQARQREKLPSVPDATPPPSPSAPTSAVPPPPPIIKPGDVKY